MRNDCWFVSGLFIAGLSSSMMGGTALSAEIGKPARLEQIPGSDLKRVILTTSAAKRLAIKTTKVREKPVPHWLTLGGEVEAVNAENVVPETTAATITPSSTSAAPMVASVRVRVLASDTDQSSSLSASARGRFDDDDDDDDHDDDKVKVKGKTDREQKSKFRDVRTNVIVVPVTGDSGASRWRKIPIELALGTDANDLAAPKYYMVNSKNHGLRPGQRVYVRLSQPASGTPQKMIPYSAVIYDSSGKTWTFTNPEPLVFVRHAISIDYIRGAVAVLKEGPASDTTIVTVGAAELMGVEQKFGH